MYFLIVGLTMFVLPIGSVALEATRGHENLVWLMGKWFVFWGVGVRLGIAGMRQYLQPAFTSRDIFGIEAPEAFALVRELGGANAAAGLVGLASLLAPSFVLPSAISAGLFYAIAGAEHIKSKSRNANEWTAMISDIFLAVVLLGFALASIARGGD